MNMNSKVTLKEILFLAAVFLVSVSFSVLAGFDKVIRNLCDLLNIFCK